nr:hypothetical protein [Photorhabdus khanii]
MDGDKGYLSQALCDELKAEEITLITYLKQSTR